MSGARFSQTPKLRGHSELSLSLSPSASAVAKLRNYFVARSGHKEFSVDHLDREKMDRENQNPERERYLQQLRALEKSLRERVQQEEQQYLQNHRQLLDGVFDAEAELAERERIATEAERVRSARRAFIQELKNRRNNARKQ